MREARKNLIQEVQDKTEQLKERKDHVGSLAIAIIEKELSLQNKIKDSHFAEEEVLARLHANEGTFKALSEKTLKPREYANRLLASLGLVDEGLLESPDIFYREISKLPHALATFNLEVLLCLSQNKDITYQHLFSFLEKKVLAIDTKDPNLAAKFNPNRSNELRMLEGTHFPQRLELETIQPPGQLLTTAPKKKMPPSIQPSFEERVSLAKTALDRVLAESRARSVIGAEPKEEVTEKLTLLEKPVPITQDGRRILEALKTKTELIDELIKRVHALGERRLESRGFWRKTSRTVISPTEREKDLPVINRLNHRRVVSIFNNDRGFIEKMGIILKNFVRDNYPSYYMDILEKKFRWDADDFNRAVVDWAESHLPIFIDDRGEVFSEKTIVGQILKILKRKVKI